MAVYKVPQDVEADDKLIGPFSFRQFVYLIIVALAIGLAWFLGQMFIGLAIIPLPIILLFGALALPLRKDQPMETYMAAMVSFFLKPHRRLWDPDGMTSLIEITTPRMVDVQLTKDFSGGEAQRRLGYLAEIVDSKGWAVRGPGVQAPNSAMNSDAYFSAQQVEDFMDDNNLTSQLLGQKLEKSTELQHQAAINIVSGKTVIRNNPIRQQPVTTQTPIVPQHIEFNPYPEDMRQKVVQPIHQTATATNPPRPTANTSEKPVATGIMNLANNPDLSVETIAREANRIHKKHDFSEEVVISLR